MLKSMTGIIFWPIHVFVRLTGETWNQAIADSLWAVSPLLVILWVMAGFASENWVDPSTGCLIGIGGAVGSIVWLIAGWATLPEDGE